MKTLPLDLPPDDVHVPGALDPRGPRKGRKMGILKTKARKALPDTAFALPEKRAYPIQDAAHARNAMARLEQNKSSLSTAEYSKAKKNILRAYKKFGIKPAASVKSAAPRGRGNGLRMKITTDGTIHVHHSMRDSSDKRLLCAVELTTQLSDDDKLVWIQVAKLGQWAGHPSGPFQLSQACFQEIVENFRATSNQRIPIDFEHASESDPTQGSIPVDGAPAQGWIVNLEARGDGLWGLVEWLEPARSYVKAGKYKYFSPAIRFGAKDRVTGKNVGCRMTSGALTNQPFLDGMVPLAASDATHGGEAMATMGGGYLYSSHEYMPAIRAALQLPALATAAECRDAMDRLSDMHEMGGGEPVHGVAVGEYVSSLREAMRLPMSTTVEEMFDAVKAMIAAAIEEHEATEHGGDESDAEMADLDDDDEETSGAAMSDAGEQGEITMSDIQKMKDLETSNATLALQLKDAEARASRSEDELKALRDEKAKRDADDLRAEVDSAFETYKDKKGLSDGDKGHMLRLCTADREAFRAMYPPVKASERHLLRDLTKESRERTPDLGETRLSVRELARKLMVERGLSLADAQRVAFTIIRKAS